MPELEATRRLGGPTTVHQSELVQRAQGGRLDKLCDLRHDVRLEGLTDQ